MSIKAPEMEKLPGVKKVKDSTQWHYWRKVPKDLLDHPVYQGKTWACRESLKTPDLKEANRRAGARLAKLDAYMGHLEGRNEAHSGPRCDPSHDGSHCSTASLVPSD